MRSFARRATTLTVLAGKLLRCAHVCHVAARSSTAARQPMCFACHAPREVIYASGAAAILRCEPNAEYGHSLKQIFNRRPRGGFLLPGRQHAHYSRGEEALLREIHQRQ